MQNDPYSILALDVGSKRIGLALASSVAKIAVPHQTLNVDSNILDHLQAIIQTENVKILVVGLPRNLNGQVTEQTKSVQDFAKQLQAKVRLPINWQDEALTSVQAEQELAIMKKRNNVTVDSLAATYILRDYLNEH